MDYKLKGIPYLVLQPYMTSDSSITYSSPVGYPDNNHTEYFYDDWKRDFTFGTIKLYDDKSSFLFHPDKSMVFNDLILDKTDNNILHKDFTIDFWFYFDKAYVNFDASTDLTLSDDYSKLCTNPYLFVYGMKNPLLSYLEKDENNNYWIPQVLAVGYNSVNQTLSIERLYTEVKQKQTGVSYPSNTIFSFINNTYFYVDYQKPVSKSIETINISANQWHHLSLSFGRGNIGDAKIRIDFGEEKHVTGKTYSCDSTITYPPNISGPIMFGNYGRSFFRKDAFISIGNQNLGVLEPDKYKQNWIDWELSTQGKSKNFGNLYISHFRFIDGYIDIVPEKVVVVNNNNAYGVINRTCTQLAINWSTLSAIQRLECVKNLDIEVYPNLNDFQDIAINPSKKTIIERYIANYTNSTLNLRLDLDHKAIVEPKKLLDIGIYGKIQQVTADFEITGNGKIMIAPTYDAMNGLYLGFNFTTMQWFAIAASEIETKGIRVDQLGAIPKSSWEFLGSKIAFAYYIKSEDLKKDKANLKSINALCEISESQENASDQIDYDYIYLSPSDLLIKFLTDGSYKINYFDEEDD